MNCETIRTIVDNKQKQLQSMKVISNRYSLIRACLLVASAFCLYYGYEKNTWFYILMVMGIVLFFWFVRLHMKLRKEIELLECTIDCYEDIEKRKSDGWKSFQDQGSEFLSDAYTQAYDLDIFGNASLFQYVSVAKSVAGRAYLASLLSCAKQEEQQIIRRQNAIKELIDHEEFSMCLTSLLKLFELHGRKKKKASLEAFYQYMESEQKTYPRFVRYLITLFPLLTISALLYAMVLNGSYVYVLICGTLSISLALLSVLFNTSSFQDVNYLANTLHDYERMFQMICQSEFVGDELQELKRTLQQAPHAIRKLQHIMTGIQFRNDGIMFMFMNAFFLIDFQCVNALVKWKKAYGSNIRQWMDALGKLEAYVSLAQLSYAKETMCWPQYSSQTTPHIEMHSLYHPLLVQDSAVANDFDANSKTYIITGSNMSGKTTFLRTIGLNMVLFHAGAQVCATSFQANSMHVFTSMRIKDDVSEGISTFYAEILRIKSMIEESKRKEPMVVLIDEIFKGTNSADRIICAQEVLKHLHLPWVISLVSTHDFELCTLRFKEEENVENYHFEEHYEDGKVCFDYCIKKDRCTTTNAQALMEMAGIQFEH